MCFTASAQEEDEDIRWFKSFLESGLSNIEAEYLVSKTGLDKGSSLYLYEEEYDVTFDFLSLDYEFFYKLVYQDDWAELTNGNLKDLPEIKPKYVGCKVVPWTNKKGVGEYVEFYDKKIPNWFILSKMDTLMNFQMKLENPLPPITGIFLQDELKIIQSLYQKAKKGKSISQLWNRFEFNRKGMVLELSNKYLDQDNGLIATSNKDIQSFNILLFNRNQDSVLVKPIINHDERSVVDGVFFEGRDFSIKIFNFQLNHMLFRFAGDIFRNPQVTLKEFLLQLQEDTQTSLDRFKNNNE